MNTALLEKPGESATVTKEGLYAELKKLIDEKGLLKKQPLYYGIKVPLTYVFVALSCLLLVLADNLWIRLLDAIFLAFMTVQVGFVGHDAGHRAIFRSIRLNDILGLFNGFFLGASFSWWMDTHNRHHGKPNQQSFDPAIDYTIMAFSEEQACRKRGFQRFMVKHQALFFIPLLMLYPINMRVQSFRYLVSERSRYKWIELTSLLLHFPVYFLFLYLNLGLWQTLLFAVIHQSLFGLYLSSVFVPNHMGMPTLREDEDLDFVRQQVITARNIKGSRIVDFLFGGLNFQIEHHLFPSMPRNRLRQARKIVHDFLQNNSITYYETRFLQSFQEILSDLRRVSNSISPG